MRERKWKKENRSDRSGRVIGESSGANQSKIKCIYIFR